MVNYVNYLVVKSFFKIFKNLFEVSILKVDSWLLDFDDLFIRLIGRRESWDERDFKLLEKKFKNNDILFSIVFIRNMC